MNLLGTVIEQGSALVTATFDDLATGLPATPKTATYTLLTTSGEVVNLKDKTPISPLTSTLNVLLSGDDLALSGDGIRIIIIEATYDSTLGSDIPAKVVGRFKVTDALSVV